MDYKRRIDTLAEDLGEEYSIRMIDGADCIYRKINDCCDIEISGALSRKRVPEMMICVWDIEQGDEVNPKNKMLRPRSLEYFWFEGLDAMKEALPGIIEKYKNYKTRQDKTRQDKTRQDKTRQDKTRQDKTRQDKTREGDYKWNINQQKKRDSTI